ncbi:MAG TPA: hypothetical protein VN872_10930 [Candidatus Acidoferrum sp.]|nr:hypothetical protein [Candidatus Acidoferrum sp.]
MRNLLSAATLMFTLLIGIGTSGCAGRTAARDSARRLAAGVQLYEQHLDKFIEDQNARATDRQKEQQDSGNLTAEGQLGTLKVANATQEAEKMIDDPQAEAQPSKLTAYLKATYQQEADLNAKLQADQQQKVKELQEHMSALQSKKAILQKIRLNLAKLAAKTSTRDEATDIQDFVKQAKQKFDTLNKPDRRQ